MDCTKQIIILCNKVIHKNVESAILCTNNFFLNYNLSNSRLIFWISCHISHLGLPFVRASFLSKYEGWKIGISFAPYTLSSPSNHLPLILVIPPTSPKIDCTATFPQSKIILGWIISICAFKYSQQASFSSGKGLRLSGGRHLIVLQI